MAFTAPETDLAQPKGFTAPDDELANPTKSAGADLTAARAPAADFSKLDLNKIAADDAAAREYTASMKDTGFTRATGGGLPGLFAKGVGAVTEKVIEPAAAKILNTFVPKPPDIGGGFIPKPEETIQPGKSLIPDAWLPLANEKGFTPALTRALKGVTTPGSLLTLPFAIESKPIQQLFLSSVVSSAPESVQKLATAETPEDVRDAAAELGIHAAFAAALSRGLKTGDIKPVTSDEIAGSSLKTPTKGEPNASEITSPESVAQREIRPPVGEATPLRQQGEAPGTLPPAAAADETRSQVSGEAPRQPSQAVVGNAARLTELQSKENKTPDEQAEQDALENKSTANNGKAAFERHQALSDVGKDIGLGYDGVRELPGTRALISFTFKNAPKDSPEYGATFSLPIDATPAQVLEKAKSVRETFRSAKPPAPMEDFKKQEDARKALLQKDPNYKAPFPVKENTVAEAPISIGSKIFDPDPSDLGKKERINQLVSSGMSRDEAVQHVKDLTTQVGDSVRALPAGTRVRSKDGMLFENVAMEGESADWHEIKPNGEWVPGSVRGSENLRGGTIERIGKGEKISEPVKIPSSPPDLTAVPPLDVTRAKPAESSVIAGGGVEAKLEAPEIPVKAAIKTRNGKVFTGIVHAAAHEKAQMAGAKNTSDSESGFVTSKGRFIDPDEAYKLATAAKLFDPKIYDKIIKESWGDEGFNDGLEAAAFEDAKAASAKEPQVESVTPLEPQSGNPVVEKPPTTGKPVTIKSAAVLSDDGTIYTGAWHPAAYEKYMGDKGVSKEQAIADLKSGKLTDGFLTSDGKFVSRDEAAKIASEAKQFKPDKEGDVAFAGALKGLDRESKIIKPEGVQSETVKTPEQALESSEYVKAKLPTGATMVRVTTEYKGKPSQKVVSKKELESGNIFNGAGVTKVEAGTVGRDGKFIPVEGEVKISDDSPQGAVSMGANPMSVLPSSATLPIKSQRQIITDLAKGLKLPIRFGRLTTSKFSGYFMPKANLIGAKRANDIPIVSHEVGHKIDDMFKLSSDPLIAAELNILGDPATPGSMSSWTPSKSKKYKLGEGMGEFVRHWLTDPAKAQKDAPMTFSVFENVLNANKDVGDVMRLAQEDINLWRTAEPQARLRSQISIGDNPNRTPYTLSQLTRDLVDDLHILRLSVDDAQKGLGKDLPPSQNPYLLARNLRGSYGMAETFIRNGVADFKTKSVQIGKSMEDALSPVAGRINDFRDWIVAKRAQELMGQGRETGLLPRDVIATASKFDADPAFQKAFADLKAWNDSVLQYAIDAGLVEKGKPATLTEPATGSFAIRKMNQDYVPFHRLFEVGAGEAPALSASGTGSGLNVGKPGSLKGLHGSRRQIVDPIETMVKNAYAVITASEKAAINHATADMANLPGMGKWIERIAAPKEAVRVDLERIRDQLEKAGADLTKVPDDLLMTFFKQGGRAPFGENIIKVARNGKQEFYRLNKDLFETFNALDLDDAGKLVKMLSAPAQLLRAGVVLEPSFNVANAIRDTFSSAVVGKFGALPFETTIKGVAAMLKNPQLVAEWAASGGKSSVEANFFDRDKMQKFLSEKITNDLTPAERAMVVLKSPLTALRWLTSVGEEATRIGEYKIALKKLTDGGMPEGEARRLAAFESRDRQDFAKGGAKTKILRHLTPFWNAALQGNVRLYEAFKQRPLKTTLQGLAFVTTAKLLEQAINWNDQDYWDRPQWERDLFFMIPAGKDGSGHTRFIRVPTPFEVGLIFGTLPGRILQYAKTHNPEAMTSFPQTMLQQSVPNPVPSIVQLPFEVALSGKQGWDVYRGRNIVPDSLANLPPDLQYTEQSSRLAKKVGSAIGVSPLKIDHAIDSTMGGMGKLLTGRAAPGKRFVSTPLSVSNQPVEDFYTALSDLQQQAARVKATGQGAVPPQLPGFEATARQMSDLRSMARKSTDEKAKEDLQNKIFLLAKSKMENYKK